MYLSDLCNQPDEYYTLQEVLFKENKDLFLLCRVKRQVSDGNNLQRKKGH